MKTHIKKITCLLLVTVFIVSSASVISSDLNNSSSLVNVGESDFDPLVDITVTVEIQKIRSLEKFDTQIPTIEKIDWFSDPDFYVKIFINDKEFTSPIWKNTKYVEDAQWGAKLNVPDDEEYVNITIQLWDWNLGMDKRCDISSDHDGYKDSFDVELIYSIKTGHWWGGDFAYYDSINSDPSGYGRLNGCDDGSIYERDRDCELWFNIYQEDFDNDGIPFWTEVNVYGTDPEVCDLGRDDDNDGIPIEWEHKWGHYAWYKWYEDTYEHAWVYDPFEWDDHANLDPDLDGLDNVEEYLTSQWGSDPFRKDLFVELDQMEESPDGQECLLPEGSKELLRTAYDRRNIVYHLDDGCMGGSDVIPFDEVSSYQEIQNIYWNYFLQGDENNWRRGVFHYGLVIYNATWCPGFVFRPDAYQISSKGMEKKILLNRNEEKRAIVYGSAYMHECGHTLGIFNSNTPGCDDQDGKYIWQKNWWKWRPYKSVMNYGYMYLMVDYSDGSRGKNDFDDWNRIDLTYFQRSWG